VVSEASRGWTTTAEVRHEVTRLWDNGTLHRAILDEVGAAFQVDAEQSEATEPGCPKSSGAGTFPIKLRLKKPKSKDVGGRFSEVKSWIQSLEKLRHVRLEFVEIRHPQLGKNRLLEALWIDSLADAVAFIGKQNDVLQFKSQVNELVAHDSRLLAWVRKRPSKTSELFPVWERLLRVHKHISMREEKRLYLRQLSVPGVDTKFIETHRSVLSEWLDLTLPTQSIDARFTGAQGFARRYGFKDKPARLRIRSLDANQPLLNHIGASEGLGQLALRTADITMDVDVVRLMDPTHTEVVVTENEINYLAFPGRPGTLAIFGSGYGFRSLNDIEWLKDKTTWYWGDIDTHGFAILNELRVRLPDVKSLLMDRDTFLAHEILWGHEPKIANRALPHLTEDEADLFADLVECRYGDGVRLEQEKVDFEYMVNRLDQILQ